MLSIEVFNQVREKANKNNINDGIAFDNPRIKTAVNEAQYQFIEWVLEKRNEDDIRLIQKLLIPDKKLKESSKTTDSHYFTIPTDFFDLATLRAIAKTSTCKDSIKLWEAKAENTQELLFDEHNKPSFYFRESFYYIANNTIRVFIDDFLIDALFMSYYRYPRIIDIEGYITLDGINSSTSNPEWDDKTMNRIISIAVKNLNINTDNLQHFQIDNTRINNKF
jgi:hypothetical protein